MSQHLPRLAFILAISPLFAACSGDEKGPEASEAPETPDGTTSSDAVTPDDKGGWPGMGDAAAQETILVRTTPLSRRLVRKSLIAVADVVSLDEVDVFPERTQPIIEVLVEEGDVVQAGQTLAKLRDDVEKLAVAEAEVRLSEAENEYQRAERDHQRNVALMESEAGGATKLISQRELETSRQSVVASKTAWEAAKVSLDRSKLDLQQTVIIAPISGTVALREISLGDMANPATRAFRLVDTSKPKAIFHRPQRELSSLEIGQKFTASCEALPGQLLTGKVERISPVVDVESGTIKITAELDTDLGMVPIGVLIRLNLVLDEHPNALMLPKKAVMFEGRNMYVFVVRDNIAHRIFIEPGFEEADAIEALNTEDSLREGDQLVTVGVDRLKDGDAVELAE